MAMGYYGVSFKKLGVKKMKKCTTAVAITTIMACSSVMAYPTIDSTFSCPTKAQVKQKLIKIRQGLIDMGRMGMTVSPVTFNSNDIQGLDRFGLQQFGNYRDATINDFTYEINNLSNPRAYNTTGAALSYPLEAKKAVCIYYTGRNGGEIMIGANIFSADIKETANYQGQEGVIHVYRKGTDK